MTLNNFVHSLLLVGLHSVVPDASAFAIPDDYATAFTPNSTINNRLVLVRPFSASDINSLAPSFDIWDQYPPCSTSHGEDVVADLFLVYSQSLESSPEAQEAVARVTDKFRGNNGWGCFGNIAAIDANIQSNLDIYQPKEQETNPAWVNGPNRHFERIIRAGQAKGYETLYLMEGDSVPVKASWLDSLLLDAELKRPFAILGS